MCEDQPGADDNASGVASLLELARLIQQHTLPLRIDLVAYTLKEPPYYFRTDHMGSYIHASSLSEQQTKVLSMISLEMTGYFKEEKGTQRYLLAPMKMLYGSRGNYHQPTDTIYTLDIKRMGQVVDAVYTLILNLP